MWTVEERACINRFLFQRRARRTYTAICPVCYHAAHLHSASASTNLRFVCSDCGCNGSATYVGLSKREKDELERRMLNLLAHRHRTSGNEGAKHG